MTKVEATDATTNEPETAIGVDWYNAELQDLDLYAPERLRQDGVDRVSPFGSSILVYGRPHVPKRIALHNWLGSIDAPVHEFSLAEWIAAEEKAEDIAKRHIQQFANPTNPPVIVLEDLDVLDADPDLNYVYQLVTCHSIGRFIEQECPDSVLMVGVLDRAEVVHQYEETRYHMGDPEQKKVVESFFASGFSTTIHIDYPDHGERWDWISSELKRIAPESGLDEDIHRIANEFAGMSYQRITTVLEGANQIAAEDGRSEMYLSDIHQSASQELPEGVNVNSTETA